MRPALLTPLFASLQSLKGIGPRFAVFLEKVAGPLVVDLLWHAPVRVIDRRYSPSIARAETGRIVTLEVEVESIKPGKSSQPTRLRVSNETGFLDLVFFHANTKYIEKAAPVGAQIVVSGLLDDFQGKKQISHPDYLLPLSRRGEIPAFEPVYALTAGLPAKSLRKAIALAVARAPALPEWLDESFKQKKQWPCWREALSRLHEPKGFEDCLPTNPARQRLAYDELLASQLALAITRAKQRVLRGRSLAGNNVLRDALLKQLPFTLTNAQQQAIKEISDDMAVSTRMLRLLQGDVGSGKTLVALIAAIQAIEARTQACIMAPTEILAQQHYSSISRLLGDMPIRVILLHGKLPAAQKKEALKAMADGTAQLIIGTHAVFQEDAEFADLGLIVIDEQHRFGVHQRLALAGKGTTPDMLVMTATPIPRTLTLTYYGDMEVSRLNEKPAGRQAIDTRALPLTRLDEVIDGLSRKIKTHEKIYWVCPLVEESELSDLAAATDRAGLLRRLLGDDAVALVHGQMKSAEKEKAMKSFVDGPASIMVATTVIEVGVDVPAATLMVIEHAERFGLAQLHQLRGRVGRGEKPSACLLLYAEPLGEVARARLKMMRETNDGFRIAEEDLRLRGPGEVLGTRQSGAMEFHLADLTAHGDLLLAARDDAKLILSRDAELESARGTALRHLLYLFQYDRAIKNLRSG